MKKGSLSLFILCFCLFSVISLKNVTAALNDDEDDDVVLGSSTVVKKEERRAFSSSENGEVTGVKVSDGRNGTYHLQFITMEPNALFLPVILHDDMLFYVHSGSGRLSSIGEDGHEDETVRLDLRKGDVYRLKYGTVFFIESNLEAERQKLRIYSIFATPNDDGIQQPSNGPYSSIRDMLLGFDEKILQAAFKVPEEVIEELKNGATQPLIVHGVLPKSTKTFWEVEAQFIKGLMGSRKYIMFDHSNKKQKTKLFNILTGNRDVENCNGWSTTVTRKNLKALKSSDMGIFMVNLTKGSTMGPHWNPMATEISIVVQGQGMVRVVSSSGKECENSRFRVEEGDVFVVPRFHPMAQMSFNNDTFVFVGFSTASGRNHPQFLAGKNSVLQTLEREVLATSFNVTNTTIDRLLAPQSESIILECTSCAEEEERMMEEEVEKEREDVRKREEEKRREEEEEERKKEEEARKRREEEEEAKRREEEEEARREEEEKREKEEEAKKREEEEARQKEEEKRKREDEEEEEARREKEDEEARQREEEKRREKEEEEEEGRQREEEKRRREEQEEEEARRREEAAAARKREEEKAEAGREQEEEEAKRQEEERRREQEEEEAKRQEEERRREEEEEEEKAEGREEKEAAARKEQEEEETRRREEEEAARREEKEAEARRREEEEGEQTEERTRQEEAAREEEEAARRQEEEGSRGQRNKKKIEEKRKKAKREFIKMW